MAGVAMDRVKRDLLLPEPEILVKEATARELIEHALSKWDAPTRTEAERRLQVLAREFPDEFSPDAYWNTAASHAFREFFCWGHDQDFGFGVARSGAMSSRHKEILVECLIHGFLPRDLSNLRLLDVGCWSGGDLLALAGMGAQVQALEEHKRSAASAMRLCELVGCKAAIEIGSVYQDRRDWQASFDVIYASGVIYHVTDPLLFARILFAYLRPGGTLILETKASSESGSLCQYSGTIERGWNWYAPTREALARWLVDAGFDAESIRILTRPNGRLLSASTKTEARPMLETAGFSRPGSWLEGPV